MEVRTSELSLFLSVCCSTAVVQLVVHRYSCCVSKHIWFVSVWCLRAFSLVSFHSVPAGDDDDAASTERNVAAVSPIPKIVTTPIKEDFSREEDECRDEWGESESDDDKKPCDLHDGENAVMFSQKDL